MMVLGHRGRPTTRIAENTVLSFLQAMQAGADGIEFDVQMSRDGELMVCHDETLPRIAGDARHIKDLTANELTSLTLRGAGNVPTLNDVTSSIPAPAILDMEIKDADATNHIIAKLKTSAALRERTIISSFHLDVLRECQKQLPEVRRIALIAYWFLPAKNRKNWDEIFALQPWAVVPRLSHLTPTRIKWLREHGVKAGAFDVRHSVRAARKMEKLGLDVAITYRPEAARR